MCTKWLIVYFCFINKVTGIISHDMKQLFLLSYTVLVLGFVFNRHQRNSWAAESREAVSCLQIFLVPLSGDGRGETRIGPRTAAGRAYTLTHCLNIWVSLSQTDIQCIRAAATIYTLIIFLVNHLVLEMLKTTNKLDQMLVLSVYAQCILDECKHCINLYIGRYPIMMYAVWRLRVEKT